jgi:hypothetical protein
MKPVSVERALRGEAMAAFARSGRHLGSQVALE